MSDTVERARACVPLNENKAQACARASLRLPFGGPWNPMWLRCGSLKSLGDSRVSLWGVLCHAFALPYVCHAFAVRLPCDCHAFAMRLACVCHGFAMLLPCVCCAFAMRVPCFACICYASWQTGVFLEGPWKYSGVPWRPWGPWGSLRGPRWVPGGVLGVPCGGPWGSWWCPWGPFGVLLGVL